MITEQCDLLQREQIGECVDEEENSKRVQLLEKFPTVAGFDVYTYHTDNKCESSTNYWYLISASGCGRPVKCTNMSESQASFSHKSVCGSAFVPPPRMANIEHQLQLISMT